MPRDPARAPAASKLLVSRGVSGRYRGARTIAVTPMGTLMNMPQRHESQLVSMPPSTMPMLPAAPLTAP